MFFIKWESQLKSFIEGFYKAATGPKDAGLEDVMPAGLLEELNALYIKYSAEHQSAIPVPEPVAENKNEAPRAKAPAAKTA